MEFRPLQQCLCVSDADLIHSWTQLTSWCIISKFASSKFHNLNTLTFDLLLEMAARPCECRVIFMATITTNETLLN